MSVRNIRAHQARGLLAPPEVRAAGRLLRARARRAATADPRAPGRRLQPRRDQAAARRHPGHGRAPAALQRGAERRPPAAERGETLTLDELGERFRVSAAGGARGARARPSGSACSCPIGDGRFRGAEPVAAGRRRGGRRDAGSRCAARWRCSRTSTATATRCRASFVELFLHEIWKPFAQADMPAERWPEIEEAVERLGPVASEAVMAIFQRRLSARVEGAFEEITRRLSERTRTRRRSKWACPIPMRVAGRDARALGTGRGRVGQAGAAASVSSGMPVSTWMLDHARPAARATGARARGRTGGHRLPRRRADPPRRDARSRATRAEPDARGRARPRARSSGIDERRVQAARARVDRPARPPASTRCCAGGG